MIFSGHILVEDWFWAQESPKNPKNLPKTLIDGTWKPANNVFGIPNYVPLAKIKGL